MQHLLAYLDTVDESQPNEDTKHQSQHFSLTLETSLVRGKDIQAPAFRVTDNPSARTLNVREEDFRKNHPWTYRVLTDNLKKRYSDFLENNHYHSIRKPLEKNKKLVNPRSLDPDNPKSAKQKFYSPNIVNDFDKHYQRRT